MAKTFRLEVVTPDHHAIAEPISSLVLPGAMGEFGVLAGHAGFLSALKKGTMRIHREGRVDEYLIGEGYAEVKAGSVIVLTETIEGPLVPAPAR